MWRTSGRGFFFAVFIAWVFAHRLLWQLASRWARRSCFGAFSFGVSPFRKVSRPRVSHGPMMNQADVRRTRLNSGVRPVNAFGLKVARRRFACRFVHRPWAIPASSAARSFLAPVAYVARLPHSRPSIAPFRHRLAHASSQLARCKASTVPHFGVGSA